MLAPARFRINIWVLRVRAPLLSEEGIGTASETDDYQTAAFHRHMNFFSGKTLALRRSRLIYRHALPIRLTHWVNALVLIILLMSGLQIFNAHPALYWGSFSNFNRPLVSMGAMRTGSGEIKGITTILGHRFDTTGILGASEDSGTITARGFPEWATIPSVQWLAMGRRWHFFFAWIFVITGATYVLYSLLSQHFSRDLLPSGSDIKSIGRTTWNHLLFRFPQGEEAKRYNVLQKIAYLIVMFVLLPLAVLTGLAMSPRMDAIFPWLLTLFDGRQSARTVHFITAFSLVAFVLIHVFMVIVSGAWNNLRSMITGRYRIEESRENT
jgi:thiosulfate reductase cytochrome b subunit